MTPFRIARVRIVSMCLLPGILAHAAAPLPAQPTRTTLVRVAMMSASRASRPAGVEVRSVKAASDAPQPGPAYKGFRVGRYEGSMRNTAGPNPGKAQLDIRSISPSGAVQAHLREFDGLEGEGDLTGAINSSGVLQLQGGLRSPSDNSVWQSALIAVFVSGNLRIGQRLTLNGQQQEESGTLTYAGPAMPVAMAAQVQQAPPAGRAPQPAPAAAVPPPARGPAAAIPPAPAGGVAGLYLYTQNFQDVDAFYFSPQGRVYHQLVAGFTQAGLDAVAAGMRGTYRRNGTKMDVSTDDGRTEQYNFQPGRETSLFSKVVAVANPQALVGRYTSSGGFGALRTASDLDLRADGTYSRTAVGLYRSGGDSFGGSTEDTGRWQYADYTITFRSAKGPAEQLIALVPARGSIVEALGQLYVGGRLYRRKT